MLQNPLMTLTFYPFGIVRKMSTPNGTSECLVSPEDLRQTLTGEEEAWETGLIQPDLLYRAQKGRKSLTVAFRNAQQSGVWLDGEDEPLRLPLPPLVLFKISEPGNRLDYRLFAVLRRPRTLDEPLYAVPLPNVYADGRICWGSVQRPPSNDDPANMTEDWNMLLGSGFNDHSTGYKSKQYEDDVRKMLRQVAVSGTKRYPLDDLCEATRTQTSRTIGDVLEGML
jgi:hypothetical protein